MKMPLRKYLIKFQRIAAIIKADFLFFFWFFLSFLEVVSWFWFLLPTVGHKRLFPLSVLSLVYQMLFWRALQSTAFYWVRKYSVGCVFHLIATINFLDRLNYPIMLHKKKELDSVLILFLIL